MSDLLSRFDAYLRDDGPAALVIREDLIPVEGPDGVFFPATFAAGDGFPGGYNIDSDPTGQSICLVDSVGSQANRIEPLFATDRYRGLVPQIVVKAGGKEVNLLDAGHRAGDALVRCSDLKEALHGAFKSLLGGDAEPLAKVAPTSLVFGVWDSRDTQAKLPRLIASTIRAYGVRKLTRSAVYVPPVGYVEEGLLEEPGDLRDAEGRVKGKHPFAQRGFVHNPASGAPGGVIASGGIRRSAVLALGPLRNLYAGKNEEKTLSLQRYILGLALTAFTFDPPAYLRQGCTLVQNPKRPPESHEVNCDGGRKPFALSHDAALDYANATALKFGVGESKEVSFIASLAQADLSADGKKGKGKKKEVQPKS